LCIFIHYYDIGKKKLYQKDIYLPCGGDLLLLFAVQLNGQYFLPADPSADAKDPSPLLPVLYLPPACSGPNICRFYKEETTVPLYRARVHQIFHNADQDLLVADRMLPSLRVPLFPRLIYNSPESHLICIILKN